MAYTEKTWVTGDVIEAADLNNMEDGIATNDTAISAILGDFATEESSTTASQAYAADDFLVYDNTLYKVTSAIASGGTITPGTNCTATTVADEISSLNTSLGTATFETFTVSSGSTGTHAVTGYYLYALATSHTSTSSYTGFYIFAVSSSGSATVNAITTASSISVSVSSNTLTIVNSGTATVKCGLMCF